MAISVDIEKCATRVVPDAVLRKMSRCSDVLKPLALNVLVKVICSPIGDKEISKSVVIIVSTAYALRPT
jgi:hypothetical protein